MRMQINIEKKKKHFATNKRHLHLSLKSAND